MNKTPESTEQRTARWKKEASQEWEKLRFWQKERLRLNRAERIYVRDEQLQNDRPGNPETQLYLIWCPTHGPELTYRAGIRRFECHQCINSSGVTLIFAPDLVPLEA